jgi:hypothetical protein
MKKYFAVIIFCLFLISLVVQTMPVFAQSVTDNLSPTCKSDGNCELNDFMRIFINISKIILGLTGSLALIAFIYGGVMFLISGGSSEKVTKAKQIIVGAVVGIIIVLASWTIIGFVFKALGIEGNWFDASQFNSWQNQSSYTG